jgi:hypothetical protein
MGSLVVRLERRSPPLERGRWIWPPQFVEDHAVLELLKASGIDYAQGYVISRPMPLAEFAAR